MKKIFLLSLLVIVSGILGLGYFAYNKLINKSKPDESKSILTSLLLQNLEGEKVPISSFAGRDFVLVLFNSTCEICHTEAAQIKAKIDLLQNAHILFVSTEQTDAIRKFSIDSQLASEHNVSFYKISQETVDNVFGSGRLPQINIYNSAYSLINEYDGEIKVSAIARHLNYQR
jgi:peroxiredoxin